MAELFPYPVLLGIAVLAGVVAGIINTLAGSGSLITLPALMMLGLPPTVANGTNRVGIVVQNTVGLLTLKQGGQLNLDGWQKFVVPVVAGAIVGALVAVQLSETAMKAVIGAVMVLMLFIVLLKPKQWLRDSTEAKPFGLGLAIAFFGVGLYGGFIQAGVGVLFLVAMVVGAGYDSVSANAVKLFITLIFTIAAVPVFAMNDQVDWALGGLMAIGQAVGAFIGGRFAVKADNAKVWIRRVLVVVATASAAKIFYDLVF